MLVETWPTALSNGSNTHPNVCRHPWSFTETARLKRCETGVQTQWRCGRSRKKLCLTRGQTWCFVEQSAEWLSKRAVASFDAPS